MPAALGESTADHVAEFAETVAEGEKFTSYYVRKEYLRGWIWTYISLSLQVDHFGSLSDALLHLQHEFGAREPKRLVHAIGLLLREKGILEDTGEAAAEIARFAKKRLRAFDTILASRIPNTCGCKIGGKPLRIDYRDLFGSLRDFLKSISAVDDCPINEYLGIGSINGKAGRFIAKPGVSQSTSGSALAKLLNDARWFSCDKCAAIGDAVIALEQPASFHLLTHDKEFVVLCGATGRTLTVVPSERAVEKNAPRVQSIQGGNQP